MGLLSWGKIKSDWNTFDKLCRVVSAGAWGASIIYDLVLLLYSTFDANFEYEIGNEGSNDLDLFENLSCWYLLLGYKMLASYIYNHFDYFIDV